MTQNTDAADPTGARLKAQRDLTSLLGATLLMTILAVSIWAFSGGGTFWPAWLIGGFAVVLGVSSARMALRR